MGQSNIPSVTPDDEKKTLFRQEGVPPADFSAFVLEFPEDTEAPIVETAQKPAEVIEDPSITAILNSCPGVVSSILNNWHYPENFHTLIKPLGEYEAILKKISIFWGHPEMFDKYMAALEINSTDRHIRNGFPLEVGEMLLRLTNIHHEIYGEFIEKDKTDMGIISPQEWDKSFLR